MDIQKELFKAADKDYKIFQSRLMPTINPDRIIGVRVPVLRKIAKNFFKNDNCKSFLEKLPHYYYEENNIHAFLIEQIPDFDDAIDRTEKFLPFIDNWATCDSFQPKVFKKNKEELLRRIYTWIKSENTYTVRYGINQLMTHFLDDDFKGEYLYMIADVKSEEYYINMMRAWYFATALAKQYDFAKNLLETKSLDRWTHNKTIQKATESYRINEQTKEYLKSLKRI